jgi:hypothetical protein
LAQSFQGIAEIRHIVIPAEAGISSGERLGVFPG